MPIESLVMVRSRKLILFQSHSIALLFRIDGQMGRGCGIPPLKSVQRQNNLVGTGQYSSSYGGEGAKMN